MSEAPTRSQDDPFVRLRGLMPASARWAYFDHAAVAPLSAPARDTLVAWADDMARDGGLAWSGWRRRIEATRSLAAALIGAETDEVALVRNTTEGLGLVAEGVDWRPGDNVVVPAGEFPSNLYPWLNLKSRGVETRVVAASDERLDPAELSHACDARTRLIALSWVGYVTGWRNDLDEIAEVARKHGARLCVDAIQGLGVLPLVLRQTPVDYLAADGHKWLLGPEGAAILFVRRSRLDELRPLGVGWNSVRHAGRFDDATFDLKPSAARYEGGSHPVGGIAALGASIGLLRDIGQTAIFQRLMELTDTLVDRLRSLDAEVVSDRSIAPVDRRSGIVSFALPGIDPRRARQRCQERGVVVNVRGGHVRASPHVWNNADDIDRLIEALRTILR